MALTQTIVGTQPSEGQQLPLQRESHPSAELVGLVGGVRVLGHDQVDDALLGERDRADPLTSRHLGGVLGVAVEDRARTFW